MTIIRMNDSHRTFLFNLASASIQCAAEDKADKSAYDLAAPLVRRLVEDRFPPKDMKLLLKYKQARHDDCIRLQLTAGGVTEFNFRDNAAAPLVPGASRYNGCESRMYAAGTVESDAVNAWILAVAAVKKARSQKMDDYKALIYATPTLDQIEAVWPAAAALRERVGRTLPVTLSDDVIARIKADAVPMKKAA